MAGHGRLAQIDTIHAAQPLWKAGKSPRFASSPPGALINMLGVKGNWSDAINDAVERGQITRLLHDPLVDIPASFDSAKNWPKCAETINDIRDQSNCGCCWAFAGAEAASDRMCIATGGKLLTCTLHVPYMCIATGGKLLVPLSAQDVCFNANIAGCQGGQIDTPWTFINHHGAVSGGQYNATGTFGGGFCSAFSLPHCHHHGPKGNDPYPAEGKEGCPTEYSPKGPKQCDSDAKGDHKVYATDKYSFNGTVITASGEKAIQQAIMAGGPVETAFSVYSDFENYVSGIYHNVNGDLEGGHAVRIVGWGVDKGEQYWKVANSWNPYWGEEGYFRIKRGNNECGIEAGITASSPGAEWKKGADPRPGPEPKECLNLKNELDCLSHKEYGTCEWCDFGSNIFACFNKGEVEPGTNCTAR